MKNLLFICLLVLAQSRDVLAQEGPAKNRLEVFVASPIYLNRLNVMNDELYPSTISSGTNVGIYLGLTYSRLVKKNWVFSGELGYGQAHHDVKLTVPTDIYDSSIASALGPAASVSSYTQLNYIQLSIWAGYQYELNNHWHIEGRVGFAQKIRFGGVWESKSVSTIATDPNGIPYEQTLFTYVNSLAADSYVQSINYGNMTGELYVGCRKSIANFFFNSFTIGIVCSHIILTQDPSNIYVNAYSSRSTIPISHDRYNDKNAALGIRIGASIW